MSSEELPKWYVDKPEFVKRKVYLLMQTGERASETFCFRELSDAVAECQKRNAANAAQFHVKNSTMNTYPQNELWKISVVESLEIKVPAAMNSDHYLELVRMMNKDQA